MQHQHRPPRSGRQRVGRQIQQSQGMANVCRDVGPKVHWTLLPSTLTSHILLLRNTALVEVGHTHHLHLQLHDQWTSSSCSQSHCESNADLLCKQTQPNPWLKGICWPFFPWAPLYHISSEKMLKTNSAHLRPANGYRFLPFRILSWEHAESGFIAVIGSFRQPIHS